MKELLLKLRSYGIGVRALTEEDFYRICAELSIEIIHSPHKFAFTFSMMGQRFIVLPRRRRGIRWLFRAFHELGHVMAGHAEHSPHVAFYGLETQFHDKNEVEADTIALVALMPKDRIYEMAAEIGETRFGNWLWRERVRLMVLNNV